jgi:m7GpppX diphosphatase
VSPDDPREAAQTHTKSGAAFSSSTTDLSSFIQSLTSISNLGANDIYSWFLASTFNTSSTSNTSTTSQPPSLKLNLIYPCTAKHIAKYSSQGVRTVHETPEIYQNHVRPYMQRNRDEGRLIWVFNIIEGRTEQEDVIYRAHSGDRDPTAADAGEAANTSDEGFLLLPDLNWDRKTLQSLHLLGLVTRRDIWSLRDLTPAHLPWLRRMRGALLAATTKLYPEIEADQLKLYVHYQPTYYHFHIHVVHVMLEAGATQAVGKAWGLEGIMQMLEVMEGTEKGMNDVTMTYGLGEASELWNEVFEPLKRKDVENSAGL